MTGNRVDLLRVLLTVGIVCRHATTTDLAASTAAFDTFTQVMVWLTEICVPLFYVLSGYLYFRNPGGSWTNTAPASSRWSFPT